MKTKRSMSICSLLIVSTLMLAACFNSQAKVAAAVKNDDNIRKEEVNLAGSKPFTEEILNQTEKQKQQQREAARTLMTELNAAIKDNKKEFVITPGYYRFGKLAIKMALQGAKNIAILGEGVHFIQEGSDGIIHLRNCSNVTITGVTLDYENLPFIQGTVTDVNYTDNTVTFEVDEDYSAKLKNYTSVKPQQRVLFYKGNDTTREVQFSTNSFLKEIKPLNNNKYRMSFTDLALFIMKADVVAGDKVVLPMRNGGRAVFSEGCEKLKFENVTLYTSPAMGIVEEGGKGGNIYRNVKIIRCPGTDRLMTTTADGFHSSLMEKGPTLDGCEFSYSEDDLLNIHGFLAYVYKKVSDKELLIASPFQKTYKVGSELNFIDTVNGKKLGKAKIVSLKQEDSLEARTIDQMMKNRGIVIRPFSGIELYRVKLDKAVAVKEFDMADCNDIGGAGTVIKNSYFHDGHGAGMRLHGPNTVVENNIISRTNTHAIYMVGAGFWAEGPFPNGVTIRSNTISECGNSFNGQVWPGAIAVFGEPNTKMNKMMKKTILNYNIVVKDNVFKNCRVGAFFGYNLADSEISGNIIDNPYAEPVTSIANEMNVSLLHMRDPYYAIFIDSANNITIKDNQFINMGKNVKGELYTGKDATNVRKD